MSNSSSIRESIEPGDSAAVTDTDTELVVLVVLVDNVSDDEVADRIVEISGFDDKLTLPE